MLGTEGVSLTFNSGGIEKIARVAWEINERTENIGARRLHTVLERLLETASFGASDQAGQTIEVDADYVDRQMPDLTKDEDLRKYIL